MTNQAIHDLLDISLNTPTEIADVFFNVSPHCPVVTVSIHPGGWKTGQSSDYDVSCRYGKEEHEVGQRLALKRVKAYLLPESIAEKKKAANSSHLANLRAQLEAAEKEVA